MTTKSNVVSIDDASSSDSASLSTSNSICPNPRRNLQLKFVWKNTWEYMIIALAFTCSPWCLWAFVDIKSIYYQSPNFYQYCIVYIFVGMPLVYMLVILGQYSQMSILHLKYMCPIGHGNGYVCLILLILYISFNTIHIADSLMYFLTTLQDNIQWMLCPKELEEQCWSGTKKCNENCIKNTTYLSAHLYWNHTYMDTLNIQLQNKMELVMPSSPRMIAIAFSVALVWFIVVFVSNSFQRKLVQWLFYFSFFFTIGLICNLGSLSGSGDGLKCMYTIEDPAAFYDIGAWSHAISVVIRNLCLGRACQMIFGSYMSSMNYSGIRTLIHVLTNMVMHILLSMMTYMSLGAIASRAKIEFDDYMVILKNAEYSNLNLIVIPQSIGFKYAPQFWNLIYFGMHICLLLSNQILLQVIFVKCINDSFGSLLRYTKYIYSALCIFTVLISILLISKGLYLFYNELYKIMILRIELILMASMSIVILWIYGIKRLSDDLHFITGQQPTKFWKIFWIINPVTLITAVITVNLYNNLERNILIITQLIFYFILTSPIPILGCIEIFKYLKKRNLVGLFQPEAIWGPPDPDERIMRLVFNPRKEIKSRRRTQTCQHKCLLGSKALKKIVQEEDLLRSEKNI